MTAVSPSSAIPWPIPPNASKATASDALSFCCSIHALPLRMKT